MKPSPANAGGWRTLDVRRHDTTLIVTLDRPDHRNAMDAVMMDELRRLWNGHPDLDGVRCIVVTGAGPGFCAGADVSMLAGPRDVPDDVEEELAFLPGRRLDVPVIVAVNGVCAGGGLHFVADGDIVLAGRDASFVDPHVSVGQVSALEPLTLRLRMRPDVLARLVLLGRGERLDAHGARDAGLVSEVVDTDRLLPRALELAAAVADGSPEAIRVSRGLLRGFEDELLARSLQAGWETLRAHWSHPDATEGPTAFVQRRPPRWQDR
jgi:enoyl-CoA hydratase/carnithine racemase